MKIKLSFVTNSSTSCFVVLGIQTDIWNLTEKYGNEIFKHYKKYCLTNGYIPKTKEQFFKNDNYDLYEFIHEWVGTVGLKAGIILSSEIIMIGKSPFEMSENQTFQGFKSQVFKSFKKLGFDIDIGDLKKIKESWEDR